MDKIDKLPEKVKKGLIKFLIEIEVEDGSEQWRAIQVAIAMILAPNSFKDNVHVFLSSHEGAHEEGAFDNHTMSIRIWPHKLQMMRSNRQWRSWEGLITNDLYRYTFPGGKHSVQEFENLLSYTGGLFCGNYSSRESDGAQSWGFYGNYTIETNIK